MFTRRQKWAYGIVAIMAAAYLAWPYVALAGFVFALRDADQAALKEQVDWPALKAGFRDDLNRFARAGAENLPAGSAGVDKGVKLSLSWSSLPLADEIAGVLATPKGLIALHDNSKAIGCLLAGLTAPGQRTAPGKCLEGERGAESPQPVALPGPNIKRWYEKFNYLFFTDPFTFRLDVMHNDVRVVLVMTRQGVGWRVVRISVPFERMAQRK